MNEDHSPDLQSLLDEVEVRAAKMREQYPPQVPTVVEQPEVYEDQKPETSETQSSEYPKLLTRADVWTNRVVGGIGLMIILLSWEVLSKLMPLMPPSQAQPAQAPVVQEELY